MSVLPPSQFYRQETRRPEKFRGVPRQAELQKAVLDSGLEASSATQQGISLPLMVVGGGGGLRGRQWSENYSQKTSSCSFTITCHLSSRSSKFKALQALSRGHPLVCDRSAQNEDTVCVPHQGRLWAVGLLPRVHAGHVCFPSSPSHYSALSDYLSA